MFIESLNVPEKDPIIVIFNGGPGVATIQLNFFALGPYITFDGTSKLNPIPQFTWAKNSSLLFIDNPAGVGFSYAEREFDTYNNDHSFRKDILIFMK